MELKRLDVETRRLQASITFEALLYSQTQETLLVANPLMAAELRSVHASRQRVNDVHLSQLDKIEQLQKRIQTMSDNGTLETSHHATDTQVEFSEEPGQRLDDSVQEELTKVTDCLEGLSVESMPMRGGVPVHMLNSWRV